MRGNLRTVNSAPSGIVLLSLVLSLLEEGLSKYILEDFNNMQKNFFLNSFLLLP
jgi:hypothetical protein